MAHGAGGGCADFSQDVAQDATQDHAAAVAQMPNPEPAALAAEPAVAEDPAEYVGATASGEAVEAAALPAETRLIPAGGAGS